MGSGVAFALRYADYYGWIKENALLKWKSKS